MGFSRFWSQPPFPRYVLIPEIVKIPLLFHGWATDHLAVSAPDTSLELEWVTPGSEVKANLRDHPVRLTEALESISF